MRKFGLIGYPLSHSFSKKYFTEKFARENISDAIYELYELIDISQLPDLLRLNPEICGLNVTIPHKESVIPYLHELSDSAREIGAVNVIKVEKNQKLVGFNSDYFGFLHSLEHNLSTWEHNSPLLKALILGTGGASKAVKVALKNLQITYQMVSRQADASNNIWSYDDLTADKISDYQLIINTSPVGMYPKVDDCPLIPYNFLSPKHFLYDLVYNPEETLFLKKGKEKKAKTINGIAMLHQQAEKAWEIWTM